MNKLCVVNDHKRYLCISVLYCVQCYNVRLYDDISYVYNNYNYRHYLQGDASKCAHYILSYCFTTIEVVKWIKISGHSKLI